MAKSIEQYITEANARLKAGKTGMVIELRFNKLCLRGQLPPRPGSVKVEAYSQRVPLKYLGNPAGIAQAEADAFLVAGQLIKEKFSWHDWIEVYSPQTATIGEILEKLKVGYIAKNSATSWQNYWDAGYKWLPQDERLNMKSLIPALTRSPKETRSRQVAFNAIAILAKFADLEVNLEPYRSTYARASLNPRDIPSDEAIAEWYYKIKNPAWKWAFGMYATYGLRNHEIFHLEFEFPNVRVVEGKTNTAVKTRLVYPLHPQWVETFKLEKVVQPVSGRSTHKQQGSTVSNYYRRLETPFKIYSLRHAWAIRNVGYGFPDTISAIAMGHDLLTHTQTYQRWLGERDMGAIFDRLMASPNRPMPPLIPSSQEQG
jgi:integrase